MTTHFIGIDYLIYSSQLPWDMDYFYLPSPLSSLKYGNGRICSRSGWDTNRSLMLMLCRILELFFFLFSSSTFIFSLQGLALIFSLLHFNVLGLVLKLSLKEMTKTYRPQTSVSVLVSTSGDQRSKSAADAGVLGRGSKDSFFLFFIAQHRHHLGAPEDSWDALK